MTKNEQLTNVLGAIKIKFGLRTQRGIAEAAGINSTHLSEMTSGKRSLTEKSSGKLTASSEKICERFGVNPDYLLNGTGNIWLNEDGVSQTGSHNTQIAGNANHVNSSSTLDKALDEIAAQRRLVAKAQEQIDRLITLLERK